MILSWAAIQPERVLVLPNTVRDVFLPGDGSTLRSALGLEGKQILLTVGRMDSNERYKGQDRVIGTIPYLISHGYDVEYVVIGDGDDRSRLEALADEIGVRQRVRFLGAVGIQTLVDAYRMADLFVLPSIGEGFGIAFLEAMVSGTPALGLDVGGARDALADGHLGTIVSESEFPSAIARLLEAPKPSPLTLEADTRTRFGRETFKLRAHTAITNLMGAA